MSEAYDDWGSEAAERSTEPTTVPADDGSIEDLLDLPADLRLDLPSDVLDVDIDDGFGPSRGA